MLNYNKQFEIINSITGFILVIVGLIYWQQKNIESEASWFIFGAMYLVMDSYKINTDNDILSKVFSVIRIVFSVAGCIASFLFLLYVL
jgi:hypothetical protein